MRSPGRPGVNQREAKQSFWVRIAPEPRVKKRHCRVACRGHWARVGFARLAGIPPISLIGSSGRYLSLADREERALLNY